MVLTSKPLGAKVYRQRPGRADEYLGKTWKPLEVQVEPGEVRFWFHHPGHPHLTGKQAVQTVTGAGPHRISVELPRGEATLTLALTPAEATATLAGRPLVSGANTVPAGPATLEVRAPGHRTQREDLDLAAGASLTRQVQLTRAEVPVQVVGYPEQAPDVPAGHWAQDEYRAAAAWIPHPDGKFQGHALATVPDVSCALVRILDHLGKAPGLDEVRPEAQGVSWQGQCLGRAVTAHVIPVDTLPPPDDPVVPRRTLAGWLSRLLARVGAIPELAPFVLKDVASSDPAYSEIAVVTSARLFPSYQARFHPDTALTRFQLAIVLANLRRFLETRGVWK